MKMELRAVVRASKPSKIRAIRKETTKKIVSHPRSTAAAEIIVFSSSASVLITRTLGHVS